MSNDYRETTSRIEVDFAAPVNITGDQQKRLFQLIEEICKGYEQHHPERTMWLFGFGAKMLCSPFMLADDEPIPFDDGVLSIECAEREKYGLDPAPAGCRHNHERQDMGTVDSTSDARTANNTMRHQYRVLTDEEKARMQQVKDLGLDFHQLVDGIGNSRELSLAKTKIEEAVMWAVKYITA